MTLFAKKKPPEPAAADEQKISLALTPDAIDLLRECRCGCDQGKRKEHRLHAMPSPTCTVRIIPASMWYSRWQW